MVKLLTLAPIEADTPADAGPVHSNYTQIKDFVNDQLINRDGSVGMAAQLTLVGDPVNPTDAAMKRYVDALLPIGLILPYAGLVAPLGSWALCNGANLPISAHPQLYSVLEGRFGTAPSGTFNLPDLRGRVPVGLDGTTEYHASGQYGGTFIVPVPSHEHTMAHTHTMPHTHEHPHTHIVNPTVVNSSFGGSHNHGVQTAVRSSDNPGGTHSVVNAGTDGTPAVITDNPVVATDGGHFHTVDIPSTATGQPNDATTDGPSVTNTGAVVTVSPITVGSTAKTGTVNAELHQPYVTIIYIIRVD